MLVRVLLFPISVAMVFGIGIAFLFFLFAIVSTCCFFLVASRDRLVGEPGTEYQGYGQSEAKIIINVTWAIIITILT